MNNENTQNQISNGRVQSNTQTSPQPNQQVPASVQTVTEQTNNQSEPQANVSTPSVTEQSSTTNEPSVSHASSTPAASSTPVPSVQANQASELTASATNLSQTQSFEMPNQNQSTATFSQPVQNPINQSIPPVQNPVNPNVQQPVGTTTQIINTDAAKAKANELAMKAKTGFSSYIEKLKTDKKILVISIIVGLVVLFLLGNYMQTGGSKGVVKTYANAMLKFNSKKLTKVYHQNYVDYMEDLMDEEMEDILDETFEKYEKRDYEILKYKIIDYEKYDKDQIEDYAEDLEDYYDIDEKDVKNVIEYSIKFTIDNDGDKEIERTEVYAVKIKNKWYIFE